MYINEHLDIDTQQIIHTLMIKKISDFTTAEILDIFNQPIPVNWEVFSSHDIKRLYEKREELIRNLMKDRKVIGHPEYLARVQMIEKIYPTYRNIIEAEHREIIEKYGYIIDPITKQSYLDKISVNIQKGGSNAQGVYEIDGTGLVAIVKGEGSYVHELPQKTLTQNLHMITVPRVIDVFVHEGKTYKIMEKSPGIQLDQLSPQQIESIPQSHYDQLLSNAKKIEEGGLKIDPSKASNFFYDNKIGFCFIDLGVKEHGTSWSMFDYIGNFNAHQYLDTKKLQAAWDRK